MKRGEIRNGRLNPNRGAEVGKTRPVLLIQQDQLTAAGLPTLVVLPLTGQLRPGLDKLRYPIAARDGLRQDSQIMIDQPRTLDRKRIDTAVLTVLTTPEIEAVEKRLRAVLGML